MRRRLLLGVMVFVGLAVVVLLGLWLTLPPEYRLSQQDFERIRKGMTLAEVEALLGGEAGDRDGRPIVAEMFEVGGLEVFGPFERTERKWDRQLWYGTDRGIRVEFDEAGKVASTAFVIVYRQETWVEKVRRWLRF